jgi:hypothetical protein
MLPTHHSPFALPGYSFIIGEKPPKMIARVFFASHSNLEKQLITRSRILAYSLFIPGTDRSPLLFYIDIISISRKGTNPGGIVTVENTGNGGARCDGLRLRVDGRLSVLRQ